MKKVSVIIPAYNEEKYIGKCLRSLKEQSYKNLEIIIVDDGSTDRTGDIVRSFKEVKLIEGGHKGPGISRNLGSRHARGVILVFVDADMHFGKDYIKNLITPIIKNGAIGTTHDYEIATNTDNIWSALWGRIRVSKSNVGDVKIFRAIKKNEFVRMGGFDSKYGYADDQTFYLKYGVKPEIAKDTTCYHRNPETLRETYKQARWIGSSWKTRYRYYGIPIINLLAFLATCLLYPAFVFYKSIKTKNSMKNIGLGKIIKFYSVKFHGYLAGLFRAILFNNFKK